MARDVFARRWGLVEFVVENRTDEPVEAEAALQFIDDPTLQYGRHAAVPARSILRTTCPVLVPDFMSSKVRYVELFDRADGTSAECRREEAVAQRGDHEFATDGAGPRKHHAGHDLRTARDKTTAGLCSVSYQRTAIDGSARPSHL